MPMVLCANIAKIREALMKKIIVLTYFIWLACNTALSAHEIMYDADYDTNLTTQHMQAQNQALNVAEEFSNNVQRRQENFGTYRSPELRA